MAKKASDIEALNAEKLPDQTDRSAVRALVVEDEALIRLDIEQARDLQPDVIVMDVKMPELDGISAAEKILEERRCAVVMLTAYSQDDLVARAADAGAMAYVVKPFTPGDLIPAVDIAISRNHELSALENEVKDLSEQFASRKAVDRAKGLLQGKMGFTEPEAFRWIQKTSMDRRLTMHEVADVVIEQLG